MASLKNVECYSKIQYSEGKVGYMASDGINKKDYEKIVEFMTNIQQSQTDFRSATLKNLSSFFGYNHLTFFLANEKGRFINPVTNNISDTLTETYDDYYYTKDIFHSVGDLNSVFNKNVVSITDIMSYRQFEDTEYYRDFLRRDNLYYEVAMPLKMGSNLLGGIGVFNPKDCGNFKAKDIAILEKLSGIISMALNNHIELREKSYKEEIFKGAVAQCPIGIIILKANYTIVSSNDMAQIYCLDILNNKRVLNPVKEVIDILFKQSQFEKDNSTNCLYTTINNYNFKVLSSMTASHDHGLETLIHIYIAKTSAEAKREFQKSLEIYELTSREIEIVDLVQKGLSNKEIASELFISYNTVKAHMENIFKKVGVDNRTGLVYKINKES